MSVRQTGVGAVAALVLFGLGTARAADDKGKATPEDLARLVAQLGAADKEERARAEKRLLEIGPAGLAALREAIARGENEPVAKAARGVVEQIGQKVQKSLENRLAQLKARGAVVGRITDDAVARAFPAHLIFAVRFPQYPAPVRPPAPLRAQNLFLVDRDGQMEHLFDFKGLEAFFRETLAKVLKEKEAETAARAWLRMSQELMQDGFLTFEIRGDGVKVAPALSGLRATARAVVKPEAGNKGHLQVMMWFGLTGDLERVQEDQEIVRGKRPRS
jgi:hypothetical protein